MVATKQPRRSGTSEAQPVIPLFTLLDTFVLVDSLPFRSSPKEKSMDPRRPSRTHRATSWQQENRKARSYESTVELMEMLKEILFYSRKFNCRNYPVNICSLSNLLYVNVLLYP